MRARLLVVAAAVVAGCAPPAGVTVASKQDAETTLLAEMATQLARGAGVGAQHKQGWGGTPVVWQALRAGDVDAYPEYTGTLALQILHDPALKDERALRAALAPLGVGLTRPLGFANNYALGLRADRAAALGVHTISDLRGHTTLRLRFSSEFMGRSDGWPGLKRHYDLPHADVAGMDHQLAYRGLSAGDVDVTDLYTTDAEIRTRHLAVLTDDRNFFPAYQAVYVYRLDLERRAPDMVAALRRLEGQLDEDTMIGLNERAKEGGDPPQIAAEFLASHGLTAESGAETRLDRFARQTREHLVMVGASLAAAVIVAVPLGIFAARRPLLGQTVLGAAGVVQTVPALALLALLIPLTGLTGVVPALVALFLYSLLPILRNTVTGLRGIPPNLREAAEGLGLPAAARLRRVELPLAAPAIWAGVRTAAVISVGTATLGALIGAGGYGQSITQGVQLNDTGRILEGAIPAALMALAVDGLFALLERVLVPKGLRLEPVK
ncbi:MAG TPA: glycine betaine ABC transporter substrate-binding protein [Gemmataceae bacterium]|jgi:osmoprotectant transport system permease protein